MFVAQKKRNANIVEYILYMFQIEDTIRACQLDIDLLETKIIRQYKTTEDEFNEIKLWYEHLIQQMKSEEITKSGHLIFVGNFINDINRMHIWLINNDKMNQYKQIYMNVRPYIQEFKAKTKSDKTNEIEIALNAVYSYLMLKLKKIEVGKETTRAIEQISKLLSELAKYYRQYESGVLIVD
ncbi:MAG: DUF4924 family protein [Salinivirgaceae bacterium]|jgi:flagellin-specific chaperone FliS|nr:DUF4924 family protein [Salinivirgaceae bacterium]